MSDNPYEGLTQEQAFAFRARAEQEAELAQAQAAAMPAPSYGAVAANAAAKGVAGFGDMFLNAPINAWNISKYITGTAMEAAGHPIWEDLQVTEPPNAIEKGFRAIGAISEEREPQTTGQRVVDVAMQTGVGMLGTPLKAVGYLPKAYEAVKNVIGGIISGTAGQTTTEATGSQAAGTAVSMGTPFATRQAMTSRANAPTLANPVKTATLRDAIDAGYVIPPSHVKPSFTTNRVESFGGKAAVGQKAALQNQQVTNRLAAEDIGLPGETVITEKVLNDVRKDAGAVYQEIADVSPRAASALEGLKQARFDAKEQWNYYARSGNPEAGSLARAATAREKQYERVIEAEAKRIIRTYGVAPGAAGVRAPITGTTALPPGRVPLTQIETREVGFAVPGSPRQPTIQAAPPTIDLTEVAQRTAGRPDLLNDLREARLRIAKTYDIEKALNLGTGDVDAHVIGRLLDQGGIASKTGNLRIIGKFARAERGATREGATVPAPGVSALEALSMVGLGTAGYGVSSYLDRGPGGAALAAVPLLRGPARAALLSKGYQSRLLKGPPELNETLLKSAFSGRSVAESER